MTATYKPLSFVWTECTAYALTLPVILKTVGFGSISCYMVGLGSSGELFELEFCIDIWYRCSMDPSRLNVYLRQLSIMLNE